MYSLNTTKSYAYDGHSDLLQICIPFQSLKEIIATPNVGDIPSTILASQLGSMDAIVRPKIDDRIDNGRNQRNSSNMNSTRTMDGLRMVRMYA